MNERDLVTDVGGIERAGKHAGSAPHHVDPSNPDQVYQLAVRLQNADDRTLLQPTAAETRGLAQLVVLATPAFEKAVELVEASDSGDAAATAAKLKELMVCTRRQLATMEPRNEG